MIARGSFNYQGDIELQCIMNCCTAVVILSVQLMYKCFTAKIRKMVIFVFSFNEPPKNTVFFSLKNEQYYESTGSCWSSGSFHILYFSLLLYAITIVSQPPPVSILSVVLCCLYCGFGIAKPMLPLVLGQILKIVIQVHRKIHKH